MRSKKKNKGPVLPINRNADSWMPDKNIQPFPLSIWSVLMSFTFWCVIGFIAFKAFQFFSVFRTLNDLDIEGECDTPLKLLHDENMRIVEGYPMGVAKPYLDRMGSQRFTDSLVGTPSPQEMLTLPPVVMAISSGDFFTVQRSIARLKEPSPSRKVDVKLIIYDIGLFKSEREILTKFCNCEVRTLDVQIYPEHVSDFNNYAYRPIIIQTIIEEFGSVIWLEPSAVVKSPNDLQMLKYRGNRHFFLWEVPVYEAITAYTHPKMFEYLGEKRCTYKDIGMMDMKTLVLYRSNETWFEIMKPWLKCALNRDCIAPLGARSSECFHYKKPQMTGCHWFDQSAFSIIMNRVYQFNQQQDHYAVPRLTTYEHDDVQYYFPQQPWSYTELVLCFTMPLVVLFALIQLYRRRLVQSRLQRRNR